MLLGVLMVVAPGAGAGDDPTVVGEAIVKRVTICHRTSAVTNPYRMIEVSVDSIDGSLGDGAHDHTGHGGPAFDPTKAYERPLGPDAWGDIIPPYRWGPDGSDVFPGLNWTAGKDLVSQCGGAPANPTTITLVKRVQGRAAATGWSFDFTGLLGRVTLTDSDPTSDVVEVDPNHTYKIVEMNPGGAAVSASCLDATNSQDGTTLSVTVAPGADAVCTFVNDYPGDPTTIRVVKAVTGPERPTEWNFGFTGLDDVRAAACPAGSMAEFCLAHDLPSTPPVTVEPGQFTLAELGHLGPNTRVGCTNVSETANNGGATTFTIAAGADAVCTFTNDYPARYIPQATGSLSLDKVVTGGARPSAATEYEFTVDCGEADLTDGDEGKVATVRLRANQPPTVFSDLPAGTVCTVTETDDAEATTTTYAVNGGDPIDAESAAATVVADATQAVVVTNHFATVLSEVEVPAPPAGPQPPVEPEAEIQPDVEVPPRVVEVLPEVGQPEPEGQVVPQVDEPEPEPKAEVKGEVVTRRLARTGDEHRDLAAFGAGLLVLGAGMVLRSRTRLRRIS